MRTHSIHRHPPMSYAVHLRWWLSQPRRTAIARTDVVVPNGDATQMLTGCVSALSLPPASPATSGDAFTAAATEYRRLLQSGGADVSSVHVPRATPEAFQAMADIEASAEVIDGLAKPHGISDDAIEACGYMAWLT